MGSDWGYSYWRSDSEEGDESNWYDSRFLARNKHFVKDDAGPMSPIPTSCTCTNADESSLRAAPVSNCSIIARFVALLRSFAMS